MKKAFVLFILFLSLCTYSQQPEFKKALGKEIYTTLNLLLEDFELNVLSNRYPNFEINKAYKEFLKDIIKDNIEVNTLISKKKKKIFNKSKLKLTVYCATDTVYVGKSIYDLQKEKDVIIVQYKCLNFNNQIDYTRTELYCCDDKGKLQALINKVNRSTEVNLQGLFRQSLIKVSNKSKYLKEYLEFTDLMGDIRSPKLMASRLLRDDVDLKDYYNRILILMNIVYR